MQPPRGGPFHRSNNGRRVLLALSFGAIGLTLAVVVLAGLGTFFIVNSGQAKVINSTSDLPQELVLCPNFTANRMVVVDLGKAGKRYRVEGECPVTPAEVKDPYIADLQYNGWTVHSDDSGNIGGYRYSSRELITIVLTQSSSSANTSAVTIDMSTGQDVPSDFPEVTPSPVPSPSPSAKPR
ncbi:MAG: hypothetical protein M3O87_04950 [Candidatus Dormibacteraeota bacterium]|nr:hypothetical protein [Candidatus Dormibacteraeota bacterium]